jgi:hypothetical protein
MDGRVQPPTSPTASGSPRGRADSPDRRAPHLRAPDLREPSRNSGGWASADDDPLTSKAFSRSALTDTDGRSYSAAHRSQVPGDRRDAALTEQTQTFSMTSQYQADTQAPTARYPAYGGQQPGQQPGQPSGQYPGYQPSQQPRQPSQSQRPQLPPSDGSGGEVGAMPGGGARNPYDRGTTSHPYPSQPYPSRPAADKDEERYGRPPRPGRHGNGGNGAGGNGYTGNHGDRRDGRGNRY